jgi:hypothetical protein
MTQVEVAPRATRPTTPLPRATLLDRLYEIEVLDAVALALVVFGIGLWAASLSSIDAAASSDYGLVGQLPVTWWMSIVAIIGALAVTSRPALVARRWPTAWLLVLGTAAFALVLHGTASAAETVPRYPTAYVHAGFADYIALHGRTLPHLDLRMSWAGFFAGVGFASRAMGVSPTWFIKWSPLVLNLAYLIPLKVIADANLRSRRARWAALWLFLAANWVGQDYLSPQGMNLFLYLTVVAVLCRVFGARGPVWGPARRLIDSAPVASTRRLTRRAFGVPADARSAEAAQLEVSTPAQLLLYGLMVFIIFASISSHQFTPMMIVLVAAALVLIGRTRLTGLWILCAGGVVAWTSFLAVSYWSGHLRNLFGGVGHVGGTLDQNVTVRLQGSSARLFVLDARIAFAIAIWSVAVFAFVRCLRQGRSHWTLLTLFLCPFGVLLGQSYGGEGVLRVFLFSLAPASVLIASLLDDPPRDPYARKRNRFGAIRFAPTVWAITLVVSLALFPIARWGNEPFEAVSTGDLAAVEWVYDHIPEGSRLVAATGALPWRYAHLTDYRYGVSPGLLLDLSPHDIHEAFAVSGPTTYLVLTRGQGNNGSLLYGVPRDWLEQITAALAGNSGFRVVYQNPDAIVVKVVVRGTP